MSDRLAASENDLPVLSTTRTFLDMLRDVIRNTPRLCRLGLWPDNRTVRQLTDYRLPLNDERALGFSAVIAALIGLIPKHAWELTAKLALGITPELDQQIRAGVREMDPESPVIYYLAAQSCSLRWGMVDEAGFMSQVAAFEVLCNDPVARLAAAKKYYLQCYTAPKW